MYEAGRSGRVKGGRVRLLNGGRRTAGMMLEGRWKRGEVRLEQVVEMMLERSMGNIL
jgi:hypothetical protein